MAARQEDWLAVVKEWADSARSVAGVRFLTMGPVTYVLVALGEKPTGGYAVAIRKAVRVTEQCARIFVEIRTPGPGDLVAQVITYPFDVAAVDSGYTEFEIAASGLNEKSLLGGRPGVTLTSPSVDAAIKGHVRVAGKARADERSLILRLVDERGRVVAEKTAVLPETTGWIAFDEVLLVPERCQGSGFLWVSGVDPATGSLLDAVVVPIKFDP